jgi:hypothetical protein
MANREIFINTAEKIGQRLCRTAVWTYNNTCTWQVAVNNKNKFKVSQIETADGNIYQGTAGISLFLIELYKYTENKKIIETAIGASLYSYQKAMEMPCNSYGFHSGRIGIAFALLKTGEISKDQKFIDYSIDILKPLYDSEILDIGIDVIGGAGGSIPPLLIMYQILQEEWIIELAFKLGDNLLAQSRKEINGLSWGSSPVQIRNLCGYAHGAAGIAHALFELFAITKEKKYLSAAEKAIEYENYFYNHKNLNWPDFRYMELGEYYFNDAISELKTCLEQKKISGYRTHYMNAWCHGAPGIGLSRFRAYEITGNDLYKKDATNAIEGTLRSFEESGNNYSLCHGLSGNCEILVNGASILNQPNLIKKAEDILINGIDLYENSNLSWPCGTINAVSDPSLLLGESGIGYFLLRLYSNNTPSLLCINPMKFIKKSQVLHHEGCLALQKKQECFFFQDTIEGLKKFNISVDSGDDIYKTYCNISEVIKNASRENKDYLIDLFLPEKYKYLLTIGLLDFSEEYQDYVIKKDKDEVNWEGSMFILKSHHDIIKRRYDWNKTINYVENPYQSKNGNYVLLYRKNNQIYSRDIGAFAGIILDYLKKPSSLKNIIEHITEITYKKTQPINTVSLTYKIKTQLIELFMAGLIVEYNAEKDDEIDLLQGFPHGSMSIIKIETLKLSEIMWKLRKINKLSSSKKSYPHIEEIETLRKSLERLHVYKFFSYHFCNFNNVNNARAKVYIISELLDDLEISFSIRSL